MQSPFFWTLILFFFSLNKNDYNIPLFKFLRIEIEYLPTMFIILTFLSLAYAMITTIIKYFYIRNSYCKKCSIELDIVALMEVEVTKYQGGSTKVGEAVSRETGESFDIYQDSYSEIDVIEKAAIYQCSKCKKNHPNIELKRDGYFRFNLGYQYDSSLEDNIILVSSKEEYDNLVENYVNGIREGDMFYLDMYNFESKEEFIKHLKDKYLEEFFTNNNLILFPIVEGSGSIGHVVDKLLVDDNKVEINLIRLIPEIGTDDMAYYTCYVNIPKINPEIVINVKNINIYREK